MKTPILFYVWAGISLSAAVALADQQDAPQGRVADEKMPKSIACSQERGESLGQCSFHVKRDETGKTAVTVVFANGFKRRLFFQDGKFLKASVTMSGVGTDTDWSLKNGMHMIRVDGQRYEVPNELIEGN